MTIMARVKLDSVRAYQRAISDILSYDERLNNAIPIMNDLYSSLSRKIKQLESELDKLTTAEKAINVKIQNCKSECESLEAEIQRIKDNVDTLKDELQNEDDSDLRHMIKLDISGQKAELFEKKSELYATRQRMNNCSAVHRDLRTVFSAIRNRISILSRYKEKIAKLTEDFRSEKLSSLQSSELALNALTKIETTVSEYNSAKVIVRSASNSYATQILAKGLGEIAFMSKKFCDMQKKQELDGQRQFFDDDGKVYRVGNELVSNNCIKKNGITFVTDNYGNTVTAECKIRLDNKISPDRHWDAKLVDIGKGDEKEGDDRGHIIAHRFGGPDSLVNAFPQNMTINRGAYKDFEDYLASQLEVYKEIPVSVSLIYRGESHRPTGVVFMYEIDGEKRMRTFPNEQEE